MKVKEKDIKFAIMRWYCCAHIDMNNEMVFKEKVIENANSNKFI
jgi:hypothetical protein